MADVKHTAEDVIKAVTGSKGIKMIIARSLGVHRNTVDNYLKRYPSARQAYDNEVETVGDIAEGVIIDAIMSRDLTTAKWYATMKLKHRGYVERQELTGAEGGAIQIIEVVRDAGNSADADDAGE